MGNQDAEEQRAIIPIRGEVVPQSPGDSWPEDIREELYQCFKVTRSAPRARRWYMRSVGEDAPVPAERTIYDWMRFYDWPARAEAEYRLEHGTVLYETERQSLANYIVALHIEADALTGAFDENPMAGAIRLKASEHAQKRHERRIQTQAPKPPEELSADTAGMSRDERESKARRSLKPGRDSA